LSVSNQTFGAALTMTFVPFAWAARKCRAGS
jgi:hypothetical protein